MNSYVLLGVAWLAGLFIGTQTIAATQEIPSLITVLGFIIIAGLSTILFFGKLSPVFVLLLGVMESSYFAAFPLATLLLGVCTLFGALYGKTLGNLALDDFYEGGQTHLPGYTVAAFLNFLLIAGFSILVWFLFSVLPNAVQLAQWFPLAGWGV